MNVIPGLVVLISLLDLFTNFQVVTANRSTQHNGESVHHRSSPSPLDQNPNVREHLRHNFRKTGSKSKKTRLVFKASLHFPGMLSESELSLVKHDLISGIDEFLKKATGAPRVRYTLDTSIRGQRRKKRRHRNRKSGLTTQHVSTVTNATLAPRTSTRLLSTMRPVSTTRSVPTYSYTLLSGTNATEETTNTASTKPVFDTNITTTDPEVWIPSPPYTSTPTTNVPELDSTVKPNSSSLTTVLPSSIASESTTLPVTQKPSDTDGVYIEGVSGNKQFVKYVTHLFRVCLQPTNSTGQVEVPIDNYIAAYANLCKIFDMFGTIFSFAGRDIYSKLDALKALQKADTEKGQNNYITMESMFAHEYSLDIYSRPGVSANRLITAALRYIAALIDAVQDPEMRQVPMQTTGRVLYDQILAPEHPWYVRGVVYLALLSFPSRQDLLDKFNMPENEHTMRQLYDMSKAIDALYYHLDDLYDSYQ